MEHQRWPNFCSYCKGDFSSHLACFQVTFGGFCLCWMWVASFLQAFWRDGGALRLGEECPHEIQGHPRIEVIWVPGVYQGPRWAQGISRWGLGVIQFFRPFFQNTFAAMFSDVPGVWLLDFWIYGFWSRRPLGIFQRHLGQMLRFAGILGLLRQFKAVGCQWLHYCIWVPSGKLT